MRIYPNEEQAIFINKTLGCSRFVYNQGLALRKANYENKLPANYGVTSAKLTEMKAEKDTAFLKEADSMALQQSLRDLDIAIKNSFLVSQDTQDLNLSTIIDRAIAPSTKATISALTATVSICLKRDGSKSKSLIR